MIILLGDIMTDLEKARIFFENDKYATQSTGIVIDDVKDKYAKCSLRLNDSHKNAIGNVMGGVLFTLADFVFAVATNFNQPTFAVTVVSQISYLNMAKGDTLFGESFLIKDGRTTCFYEIKITDNLGTDIAVVSVTGSKISKK